MAEALSFTESDARLSGMMLRTGGLQYALLGLQEIVSQFRPIARVNVLYCPAGMTKFISLADTKEGKPVPINFRFPGKEPPLLRSDLVAEDVILDDLDQYKRDPLYANSRYEQVPFMDHRSVARFCLINNESYYLLINFWSDECQAFMPEDIPALRQLIAPMVDLLRVTLPEDYGEHLFDPLSKNAGGMHKLKLCSGLIPVMRQVEAIAPTECTVLILGESGVGKEAVADAIHELSPRNNGPLIKVNCGAIPETLLDSEMFGYEKGAFTGATSTRAGYFELAQNGTIFLDEIGEMSLSAQVRLLRVLDRSVLTRVGGAKPISLNVRVIAATHNDLPQKVRSGAFRKDLWYRLAGFPIEVPPLRRRIGDIEALVDYFVRSKAEKLGQDSSLKVSQSSLHELYSYNWPGNVRELEHLVERALILSRGKHKLRFELSNQYSVEDDADLVQEDELYSGWPSLTDMENRYIQAVLKRCRGKLTGKGGAASVLGIHYTTLRARMRQLGIPLPHDV